MLSAISRNLPRNKPELWENFPRPFIRHISALKRREVTAKISSNLRMKLDLRDQIARSVYLYGEYDPFVSRAIRALLKVGQSFVDVGANIGVYSLMASRIVGPQGCVYSFEPVEKNATHLRENIALNQLSNIRVFEKAVSDLPGSVDFYDARDPSNTGSSSLKSFAGASKLTVPCTTLDGEFGNLSVNVVKIDAEGCDDRVVIGGEKLFTRTGPPSVICEGGESCDAARFLREFGYSIAVLPRRWYTPENFIATKGSVPDYEIPAP